MVSLALEFLRWLRYALIVGFWVNFWGKILQKVQSVLQTLDLGSQTNSKILHRVSRIEHKKDTPRLPNTGFKSSQSQKQNTNHHHSKKQFSPDAQTKNKKAR